MSDTKTMALQNGANVTPAAWRGVLDVPTNAEAKPIVSATPPSTSGLPEGAKWFDPQTGVTSTSNGATWVAGQSPQAVTFPIRSDVVQANGGMRIQNIVAITAQDYSELEDPELPGSLDPNTTYWIVDEEPLEEPLE